MLRAECKAAHGEASAQAMVPLAVEVQADSVVLAVALLAVAVPEEDGRK